jgi:cell division protein FtsB
MSRSNNTSRRLVEHNERSNSPRSTNYYFSNLTDSNIIKDQEDNSAFKFIVLQNDALHEKTESLIKTNTELESDLANLEDDRDNLEKQKLALRGYLKNEIELQKLYQSLNNQYKLVYEHYKNKFIKERILWLISCLFFIPFMFLPNSKVEVIDANNTIPNNLIRANSNKVWIFYTLYLLGILGYIIIIYLKYPKIIKQKEFDDTKVSIIKLRKQINDTIKGNELLDQLVENL